MFMYGLLFVYAMWIPALLLLGAIGVVLVVRSVGTPSWMRRGAGCAACGYELTTLREGRCPECGASLLKVGVTTPRLAVHLRGNTFLLVTGWTMVVCVGTAPVLGFIGWIASMQQVNQMMAAGGMGTLSGPANYSSLLVPGAAADRMTLQGTEPEAYSIAFDANMITDDSDSIVSGLLVLAFNDTPNAITVTLDLSDKSWTTLDGTGEIIREGVTFGAPESMQAYRDAGLDVTSPSTLEEAAYLSTAVDEFWYSPEWSIEDLFVVGSPLVAENVTADWSQSGAAQSMAGYASFSPMSTFGAWEATFLAVAGLAIVVYFAGLVLLVMKRSRMMRMPMLGFEQ